jgi:hypothetical protein
VSVFLASLFFGVLYEVLARKRDVEVRNTIRVEVFSHLQILDIISVF